MGQKHDKNNRFLLPTKCKALACLDKVVCFFFNFNFGQINFFMYLFYNDVTLNGYDERKYHNMCEMPGMVSVNELYLLYTSVSMAKFIPV